MVLASCSDYLDVSNPNAVPSDRYFSSEIDVDKAVAGIYNAIRNNNCLGEASDLFSEERTDNAGRLDNQSSAGEPFQFTNFSLLPGNTNLKSHWSALYVTVSRANYVLSYVDDPAIKFADEKTRKIYKSEALFLRALTYFHLVRKWGDVPMVTENLTSYDAIVAHTYRVPQAEVYAQIVADLKAALDSELPNLQAAAGKGRTCKAAINGLLGQVYLTMGELFTAGSEENLTHAGRTWKRRMRCAALVHCLMFRTRMYSTW